MGAIVVSIFVTLVVIGSVIYFHYRDERNSSNEELRQGFFKIPFRSTSEEIKG